MLNGKSPWKPKVESGLSEWNTICHAIGSGISRKLEGTISFNRLTQTIKLMHLDDLNYARIYGTYIMSFYIWWDLVVFEASYCLPKETFTGERILKLQIGIEYFGDKDTHQNNQNKNKQVRSHRRVLGDTITQNSLVWFYLFTVPEEGVNKKKC